eukprot:scaffold20067_cov107-Isochrysis_galbana.AAC.1
MLCWETPDARRLPGGRGGCGEAEEPAHCCGGCGWGRCGSDSDRGGGGGSAICVRSTCSGFPRWLLPSIPVVIDTSAVARNTPGPSRNPFASAWAAALARCVDPCRARCTCFAASSFSACRLASACAAASRRRSFSRSRARTRSCIAAHPASFSLSCVRWDCCVRCSSAVSASFSVTLSRSAAASA